MSLIIALTTVQTEEDANKIAIYLIENKLASCVNVSPGSTSYYFWEGEISKNTEFSLSIKSIKNKEKELINAINDIHPYDIPEIIILDSYYVEKKYMDWTLNSLK